MNEESSSLSLLLDQPSQVDEEEPASKKSEPTVSNSDTAQLIREMNEWLAYQKSRKWYFHLF